MGELKRKQIWIDAPLQLQLLGYVLAVLALGLVVVGFSVLRGLEHASSSSHELFHSLDWTRQAVAGPLVFASTLVILAAGLLTLFWSHRYAGPLRVLSGAIARMRRGDLGGQVRVRDTDAHQELVREFAEMQQELRARALRDRDAAVSLSKRLEDACAQLPKEHPSWPELSTAIAELKRLGDDYHF